MAAGAAVTVVAAGAAAAVCTDAAGLEVEVTAVAEKLLTE